MNNGLPLRDIHLPDSVSWWPPAIGWWLLLLLAIGLLVLLWVAFKKIKQPVLKKSAKAEIMAVISHFRQHQDAHQLMQELSVAFKRVGISYLHRDQVAGLTGQAWYQRINQLVEHNQLSESQITLLSMAPYQKAPQLDAQQVEALVKQVEQWVSALPRYREVGSHV